MTVNRGLWVPINTGNVGTTDLEARLAMAGMFESNDGVNPRSGLLRPASAIVVSGTAATAPMAYNIAQLPGVVINRVTGEGAYQFSATGVTNVATTNAPGANSRIDIIWVKQNDQTKGDANNLAVAGVTQGAAAATPLAPTIPVGAIELARATITSTTTNTAAASITQTFRYTALAGDAVPVRNTTERAEITAPRTGQTIARLDLDPSGAWVDAWSGSAWDGLDTGWVAVTYSGAWSSYGLGFSPLQVRRVNRVVYLRGSVKGGTNGSTIGVLPAGFRPNTGTDSAFEVPLTSVQSGTWFGGSLLIYSGGNLTYASPPGVWSGSDRVIVSGSWPV